MLSRRDIAWTDEKNRTCGLRSNHVDLLFLAAGISAQASLPAHTKPHVPAQPPTQNKKLHTFLPPLPENKFFSRLSFLPTRPSTHRRRTALRPSYLPTTACARRSQGLGCPPCWRCLRAGTERCSPSTSSAPWSACGSCCDSRASWRRRVRKQRVRFAINRAERARCGCFYRNDSIVAVSCVRNETSGSMTACCLFLYEASIDLFRGHTDIHVPLGSPLGRGLSAHEG